MGGTSRTIPHCILRSTEEIVIHSVRTIAILYIIAIVQNASVVFFSPNSSLCSPIGRSPGELLDSEDAAHAWRQVNVFLRQKPLAHDFCLR